MASIQRCSNTVHHQHYDVSQHSFYTALFALIFAELENKRKRINNPLSEDYYDIGLVLKKAVIHDIEEAETGDILFQVKHNPELKQTLAKLIETVVDKTLFIELEDSIKPYLSDLWKNSKDDSKEGRLIAAMDKFELLIFAYTEVQLGNKAMADLLQTAAIIIKNKFSEIVMLQQVTDYCLKIVAS